MAISISNSQSYNDFIKSNDVVLVHFWAEWNGVDILMKRILLDIEKKYQNSTSFGSVDVDIDDMSQICREVGMVNIPALVYYQDGKYIETTLGLKQKEDIENNLNRLLKDVN